MVQAKLPCLFKGGGIGSKIAAGLGLDSEGEGADADADEDQDALIAAIEDIRKTLEAKEKKLKALKVADKEKSVQIAAGIRRRRNAS